MGGESNQSGPQTSMHQSDLSFYEATNKNFFRLSYDFEDREDSTAFGMSPPTPLNGLAGNCLSQVRDRTPG